MKKLIIVCEEKCRQYGDYLAQLISLEDDTEDETVGTKDGEVAAQVRTTLRSLFHCLMIWDCNPDKSFAVLCLGMTYRLIPTFLTIYGRSLVNLIFM